MLNNPKHSDVTTRASDGTLYHGHLAFIEMHTDFFSTAVSSHFSGSKDRTISFPDHDPEAVKSMMNFLYTAKYTVSRKIGASFKMSEWLWEPLEVYKLADYVMVPALKQLTMIPMMRWFENFDKTSDQAKRELVWQSHLTKFAKAVYQCTNSDPGHQPLRKMVVELCANAFKRAVIGVRLNQ